VTGTSDPDAVLKIGIDPEFDEPGRAGSAPLPPIEQLWQASAHMDLPKINIDEKPSTLQVIDFVFRMEIYKGLDKERARAILSKVFEGKTSQDWCIRLGYDLDKVINKLINWMHSSERPEIQNDLEEHIHYFKQVAKYMGFKIIDEKMIQAFLKSLGPEVLNPTTVWTQANEFLPFKEITY